LIGSGDRRLFFSPVVLTTFATDGSLVEAECAYAIPGHFVEPGRLDVLAIGANGEPTSPALAFSAWLLADFSSGRSSPQRLDWEFSPELEPLYPDPTFTPLAVRAAAADLDGDGLDEVVLAAPLREEKRCRLAWADVTEGGARLVPVRELSFEEECRLEPPLALRDFDGDGAMDVAILTGPEGAGRIRVLWNDGYGNFSAEDATLVADETSILAFVPFQRTPASPLELAYTTATEVKWLEALGAGRSFSEPRGLGGFTEASGLTAGDIDGDGVTDLGVADAGGVRVLRAELDLR
jgi:hypothetical protein